MGCNKCSSNGKFITTTTKKKKKKKEEEEERKKRKIKPTLGNKKNFR